MSVVLEMWGSIEYIEAILLKIIPEQIRITTDKKLTSEGDSGSTQQNIPELNIKVWPAISYKRR